MRRARYRIPFAILSTAFLVAAAFHVAALASPAFARRAYPASYTTARHWVFIVLCVLFAWLLTRRPAWFVWAFAALVVELLSGHGLSAWRLWTEQHRIDWLSVVVVAGTLLGLGLLVAERRRQWEPASPPDRARRRTSVSDRRAG